MVDAYTEAIQAAHPDGPYRLAGWSMGGVVAFEIARRLEAEIELLHVVEFLPVEPMAETLMATGRIENELLEQARARLAQLAGQLGFAGAPCWVETGNVKAEIVRLARKRQADLIVLGSRERHGMSILVNLTEDTVLHAAPCDVLAVRVKRASAAPQY